MAEREITVTLRLTAFDVWCLRKLLQGDNLLGLDEQQRLRALGAQFKVLAALDAAKGGEGG